MIYRWLADLVVLFHAVYVAFIVLGQAAILIGGWRGWRWVRNPWFRGIHLALIAIVALEALLQIPCPLTVWEARFRQWAGEEVAEGSFVGRLLDSVLFWSAPEWALALLHIGFALLVAGTLWLVPPIRQRRPASHETCRALRPDLQQSSREGQV